MGGRVEKVTVGISGFVEDCGEEIRAAWRQLNRDVKKIDGDGRYRRGELDRRVEVTDKVYKLVEVNQREIGNAETIVNVTKVENREGTIILILNKVFKVAHEEAGVARAHFSAHGDTADLIKELSVELKGVELEN